MDDAAHQGSRRAGRLSSATGFGLSLAADVLRINTAPMIRSFSRRRLSGSGRQDVPPSRAPSAYREEDRAFDTRWTYAEPRHDEYDSCRWPEPGDAHPPG